MDFRGIIKAYMDSIGKQKIEIAVQERELKTKEFFDGFSRRRRITFFTLVVLIIPIYFITKNAVAAVYLRSFSKTQISAHPASLVTLPIEVVETKALTMVGDTYSAYALVKNQNKDLVAKDIKYTFTFFDAAGKPLGTSSDKTFLLGGEQKYLILPNIRLNQKPSRVTVEIAEPEWKKRLGIPNVVIKSSIPQYFDSTDPLGFEIDGTIQNQSESTVGAVKISAIVLDKSGKVIGVTQRVENILAPQEIRGYKMFWPIPLAGQISGAPKIITEVNVLDIDNIK
jgi:hypothetical protein